MRRNFLLGAAFALIVQVTAAFAQDPAAGAHYLVGPHDVLIITSYDQPDLTGTFTVETDGTFTYPLIGRVSIGGMTLRAVEELLKTSLVAGGFFKDPQITVAVEHYRSQKVYLVGEVRSPGAYPLSGDMRLVEAIALAGSTTPMASSEVVVVDRSSETV